jgi:hypothetical protein
MTESGNSHGAERFERQLATCRGELSPGQRGTLPLQLLEYDGEVYPLLETQDEFEWFCTRVGIGALRAPFYALDPDMDPEYAHVHARAQAFCAQCRKTVFLESPGDRCAKCGSQQAMLVYRLDAGLRPEQPAPPGTPSREASRPAAIDNSAGVAGPVTVRGRAVTGWTVLYAIAIGAGANGLSGPRWAAGALAVYGLMAALGAWLRSSVVVDRDAISFRSLTSTKKVPLAEVGLLKLEHVIVRGALLAPVRSYARIELFDRSGKQLHYYSNERFTKEHELTFLRAFQAAAPNVRITAPKHVW